MRFKITMEIDVDHECDPSILLEAAHDAAFYLTSLLDYAAEIDDDATTVEEKKPTQPFTFEEWSERHFAMRPACYRHMILDDDLRAAFRYNNEEKGD